MKNKISDLRNHLFVTIESLQDPDQPMEIERAKAIANAAQVIVNSAKVENDFIRLTGNDGSGFIETPTRTPLPPPRQPRITGKR